MVGKNKMCYVEKRIDLMLINMCILFVFFVPFITFTMLCDHRNTKEFIRSVKIRFSHNCGEPQSLVRFIVIFISTGYVFGNNVPVLCMRTRTLQSKISENRP